MKHPLFLLLAAAFMLACTPQKNANAQKPAPAPVAGTKAESLIQLETGSCRGFCPVYKLDFRKDGTLEYTGIRNMEKNGTTGVRLTAAEYAKLLQQVNRTDLWQYPDELPSTVADAPSHTFTVFEGGKSKSLKVWVGIPQPVQQLESLMQDIAEAHGIKVRKGVDPNNPDNLKGEVIVKFNMNTNAKEFCNQFSDLKVRTLKHLSEDNTWIIGYDPAQVTETQFISLIKDMEGVLNVEPNKQVNQRN